MRNLAKIVAKGDPADTDYDTLETLDRYVNVKDGEGLKEEADKALKEGRISPKKHQYYTKQAGRIDVMEASSSLNRWFDAGDLSSGITMQDKDQFVMNGKKAKEYFEQELNKGRDPKIVAQEAKNLYTTPKVYQVRTKRYNEDSDIAKQREMHDTNRKTRKSEIFRQLNEGKITEKQAREMYQKVEDDYTKAISQ
jgi:hypothetical protein